MLPAELYQDVMRAVSTRIYVGIRRVSEAQHLPCSMQLPGAFVS